jgi:hypothetical protein
MMCEQWNCYAALALNLNANPTIVMLKEIVW